MLKKQIALSLIVFSLILTGCTRKTQPSVLLIVADDLSFIDTPCSLTEASEKLSGLQTLCNESVRFTHAYTPSTLSTSSLASIFTAQYPYQHHVRDNGNYLPPEVRTASEVFAEKGYRTAFFSGGAPILRKTGLNQGFELFDDQISFSQKQLFRPFRQTSELLLKWLDDIPDGKPLFAVIYAPDLIFTNTLTADETGQIRNFSYESQLAEFDLQLHNLIKELKKRGMWNHLHFVVAGLNGQTSSPRSNEISPLNLHSENTQVALFIKPATQTRDLALSSKMDKNVSLIDLGATLFDWAGEKKAKSSKDIFANDSLAHILPGGQGTLPADRPILIESAWSKWRTEESVRYAVIKGFNFWIHDSKPRVFNTLIDRFEMNPLPVNDNLYLENTDILQRLAAIDAKPWFTRFPKNSLKYKIPFQKWMRNDQAKDLQRALADLYANHQDTDTANWLAYAATQNRDWETLYRLGTKTENTMWTTAAVALLNRPLPKGTLPDHCFLLLSKKPLSMADLKTCADKEYIEFISWVRSDELGLKHEKQKILFVRNYWLNRTTRTVAKANIAMSAILDTSNQNTLRPTRTELALNLPAYKKHRVDLQIELENLDLTAEPVSVAE